VKKLLTIINEEIQRFNENFWQWFGNSKVIDGQGNPLKVYHGTTADFSEFKGGLMYFAVKPQYANQFASNKHLQKQTSHNLAPSVLPVYLRIENPLDLTELGNEEIWVTDFIDYVRDKGVDVKSTDFWNEENKPWNYLRIGSTKFVDKIRAAGYDGIIMYEDTAKPSGKNLESQVFVVFDNAQIKSATGNNGEYTNSPDITKESI